VAVTLCDTIEELTGLRPGIKWINDLVLNRRKLAGILTELGFTPQGLVDYAVVGIGINLSHTQQDFPQELQAIACSLFSETGMSPDPSALAAKLMVNLEAMSRNLLSQQKKIMAQYRKDCITLGAEVKVISPSQTRQAQVLDICDDGALIALFPDGHQETVSSGEVSVRGLWDYV
jgi:BirA family biotin operon repressor/biotin-[acetyl-CoA-carboxylase] ligase